MKSPAYCRARMSVLESLLREENKRQAGMDKAALKESEHKIAILRNGSFPKEYSENELVEELLDNQQPFSNKPLRFSEISRYNNWFVLHPEKIAGQEVETTSKAFPLEIKGDRNTIISTIRNGMQKNPLNHLSMSLQSKIQNILHKYKHLSSNEGLHGLDGLEGLGELVRNEINQNLPALREVLVQSQREHEYDATDTLSFSEVVESYNKGISEDEIIAWVWYKRSLGVTMTGWEKYFLSNKGEEGELLVTLRKTLIKDNHFRDVNTVGPGIAIGKPTRFTNEYDGTIWLVFTAINGDKQYVSSKDVKLNKTGIRTDPKQLDELVRKGVLFYLDGDLLPYPIYAYGNMYDRELQLEKDKEHIIEYYGQPIYDNHREIIRKAKPELLSVTNPDERQRPKILAISSFAETFRIKELREETGIILNESKNDELEGHALVEAFRPFLESLPLTDFEKSSAHYIINYYLGEKKITDKTFSKEQKAEIKALARNEGEKLFSRFLHEALLFEDQEKLNVLWNRTYNGQSNIAYHRIPIGFQCSAKFKQFNLQFTPAQREGVAFMEAVGSGIIAFDVGVGKTMTAIIALAQAIFSGRASRPLIVVPNPTFGKWIKEIIGYEDELTGEYIPGVLSNTKIKLNEWYNLGSDVLGKIKLDRKIPEKTITVVTYEGFKKIGYSKKVMDAMFEELVHILYQSNVDKSSRDKEIDYQQYREIIGVGVKDTIADIDTLGIDYLVIDEAHRCKNIFEMVKADKKGKKRFGISGAVSDTGIKAFFLCNYIQRTYGRNVMLLTATPFTNSPLEIYSMLSLVAYDSMKKAGIYNLQAFFELFVLERTEYVVNYKEEIVARDTVKSFNNRMLLQKLIYNHINYKTGEEAGIRRPVKVNLPRINTMENGNLIRLTPDKQVLTYLRMTERQRNNQNEITSIAQAASSFNTAAIFQAMNRSLDNALSPFLYEGEPEDHKEFIEESPKLHYIMECVASVKKWHEQRNESVSGQVIYLNRGKHFFPLIKEYLEKEVGFKQGVRWNGMKVDEVEIISSEISQTRKENVKEAFLDGAVKVIIGTATIREGIDLQRKSTVIYNAYPDWNPTDIRQLEGRIWRQGNEFGYVRSVMPLVQDSMDVFIFQKLEEKTARINDIWYRGDRGNVLDLESLDPEEVKYALLSDIEEIAEMQRKQIIAEANRRLMIVNSNISTLSRFKSTLDLYYRLRNSCIKNISSVKSKLEQYLAQSYFSEAKTEDQKVRAKKLYEDIIKRIEAFLESSGQSDQELLKTGRSFSNDLMPKWLREDRLYGDFKEALSIIRKAEKGILGQKGYTINDNLDDIIAAYHSDRVKIELEIERYQSDDYFASLKYEVQQRKSAMAILGANVHERAAEFARLNYLMSYRISDVQSGDSNLPLDEKRPDADENNIRMKAKMKMKIKILLMKYKYQKAA
jgi:superfamily II DNA or RNA helicase